MVHFWILLCCILLSPIFLKPILYKWSLNDQILNDLKIKSNGIEEIIYDKYSDLINEIQLKKEISINRLQIDDDDDSELTNDLKIKIKNYEKLSDIIMNEVENDKNEAILRSKIVQKREIITQLDSIIDYLNFILKELIINCLSDVTSYVISKMEYAKTLT